MIPRIDPTRVYDPGDARLDGTVLVVPLWDAWGVDGPDASLFGGPAGANHIRIPLGGLGHDGRGNLYQLVRSLNTVINPHDVVIARRITAAAEVWDTFPLQAGRLRANTRRWLGVSMGTFPAAEAYGWAQIRGYSRVNVLNGATVDDDLYTSATNGHLGTTSGGNNIRVHGIGLSQAATADGDVPCFLTWPTGALR